VQALVKGHIGEDIVLGLIHQLGHVAEPLPQVVGDLTPAGMGLIMLLLGANVLHNCADHRLVGLAHPGQQVALEMHAATLPSGAQDLPGSGLPAFMGVADHQLPAAQPAARERLQKVRLEGLSLRGHDGEPQDLMPPVCVDCHGHYHRHQDEPPALAQRIQHKLHYAYLYLVLR
jgi:hypothetical protein